MNHKKTLTPREALAWAIETAVKEVEKASSVAAGKEKILSINELVGAISVLGGEKEKIAGFKPINRETARILAVYQQARIKLRMENDFLETIIATLRRHKLPEDILGLVRRYYHMPHTNR